jgi:hypothetical protein
MTVDPELAETGQPYAFAGDDPVNETDPSGMLPKCVWYEPWTFPWCATKVASHVLPMIEKTWWFSELGGPGYPCAINALTVVPTVWARFAMLAGGPDPGQWFATQQFLLNSAWDQVVRDAGASANTSTMFDQFACHWYVVREFPWRDFHLELWRPDIGFIGFVRAKCN